MEGWGSTSEAHRTTLHRAGQLGSGGLPERAYLSPESGAREAPVQHQAERSLEDESGGQAERWDPPTLQEGLPDGSGTVPVPWAVGPGTAVTIAG